MVVASCAPRRACWPRFPMPKAISAQLRTNSPPGPAGAINRSGLRTAGFSAPPLPRKDPMLSGS